MSDPDYDRIPQLHDAFKSYGLTLGKVGLPVEQQFQFADGWLNKMRIPSPTHKAAILGLAAGFKSGSEDAFVHYAQYYLNNYPLDNPNLHQQLKKETDLLASRLIGAEAPDIVLPSPEGDTLKLSELKGKVVLVDFWASWCGPCRRENPRVRALYEKYKDQGFEIYGVSLDKDKNRWVQAIEKDQLSWLHVSDLKYWQSTAARQYGVHSIPHTVLLDTDGKIAAKKLRGAALEKKVAELLGE